MFSLSGKSFYYSHLHLRQVQVSFWLHPYLRIVASRSGPTPIHFTGAPAASSIILIYAWAFAGNSSNDLNLADIFLPAFDLLIDEFDFVQPVRIHIGVAHRFPIEFIANTNLKFLEVAQDIQFRDA